MKNIINFRIALFIAIIGLSLNTLAQKVPFSYGKIDKEWLSMTSYNKDPEAEAVVIGDFGDISFDYFNHKGFIVKFKRTIRVKIFNSKGFSSGDFKIILYQKNAGTKEALIGLKGVTYNLEDGKVVKTELEKNSIFQEQERKNVISQSFSMPNLKEGSVFELTYTITSPFLFNLPNWAFQRGIPTVLSELWVSMPEYFNYKTLMKGFLGLTERETKSTIGRFGDLQHDEQFTRYVVRDAPAFREEPYMNSVENYYSQIDFELESYHFPGNLVEDLSSSWEKINTELLDDEEFGLQYKRTNMFGQETQLIKGTLESQKEQMIACVDLVKKRMTWDNNNSLYSRKSILKSWNDKTGNSAEINLILVAMLREMGLEANPVILSTRNHGMIHPGQILLSAFNYVIAQVKIGEETFLLDATDKDLHYTLLPQRCLNGQGRVITDISSNTQWVNINPSQKSETTSLLELKILPNGNMTGTISIGETNYMAYNTRNKINSIGDTDKYANELETKSPGFVINNITIENQKDISQPLNTKMEVGFNLNDEQEKQTIIITPMLINQEKTNYFNLEVRNFPVDFVYPFRKRNIHNFEIPEGYKVVETPKNIALSLPESLGLFRFNCAVNGSKIQITSTFDINKAIISPVHYQALREFYSAMVSKHAEVIVLEKL